MILQKYDWIHKRNFLSSNISKIENILYRKNILSTNQLTLPDFLGIGAQKSATSWLDKMLRCHPELYLPSLAKEIHFFNSDFNISLKGYSNIFMAGKDKIKGEITPAYSNLPVKRIKFIKSILPDIKLIFLIRNPIDRAWSHALMDLAKLNNRKFEEITPAEFYSHFESQYSRNRGNYLDILNNWLNVFSDDNVCVGFLEEVINDPKMLLTKIFRHIGVSVNINWMPFKLNEKVYHNQNVPIPREFRLFLKRMYSKEIIKLHNYFDNKITEKWLLDCQRIA